MKAAYDPIADIRNTLYPQQAMQSNFSPILLSFVLLYGCEPAAEHQAGSSDEVVASSVTISAEFDDYLNPANLLIKVSNQSEKPVCIPDSALSIGEPNSGLKFGPEDYYEIASGPPDQEISGLFISENLKVIAGRKSRVSVVAMPTEPSFIPDTLSGRIPVIFCDEVFDSLGEPPTFMVFQLAWPSGQ